MSLWLLAMQSLPLQSCGPGCGVWNERYLSQLWTAFAMVSRTAVWKKPQNRRQNCTLQTVRSPRKSSLGTIEPCLERTGSTLKAPKSPFVIVYFCLYFYLLHSYDVTFDYRLPLYLSTHLHYIIQHVHIHISSHDLSFMGRYNILDPTRDVSWGRSIFRNSFGITRAFFF